jgi:hypothetical protein
MTISPIVQWTSLMRTDARCFKCCLTHPFPLLLSSTLLSSCRRHILIWSDLTWSDLPSLHCTPLHRATISPSTPMLLLLRSVLLIRFCNPSLTTHSSDIISPYSYSHSQKTCLSGAYAYDNFISLLLIPLHGNVLTTYITSVHTTSQHVPHYLSPHSTLPLNAVHDTLLLYFSKSSSSSSRTTHV